jgi:hypothetical protein
MRISSLAFGAALALLEAPVLAADASPPVILRGTIVSVDADSIAITEADGAKVNAAVAPDAEFSVVEHRRFEQIKVTDFVGVTSVPGPNDTMKAEEIHIIPQRGFHEGSYPWDHRPDGAKPTGPPNLTSGTVAVVKDDLPASYTMTNASVTASSGMQLKVTYQGSTTVHGKCVGHAPEGAGKACTGVAVIEVPPWTPVVAIVPGKPSDAKAGLVVFATGVAGPQGKLVVSSLIVEKNGTKPLF